MKLYLAQIPAVSRDLIQKLLDGADIEVAYPEEAQLDVEAILKEYLRVERDIMDRAKEILEKRRLPYEQLGRIRKGIAEEHQLGTDEDTMAYLSNQIVESFMNSPHVDEVFTEEGMLRRKIQTLLKKHMMLEGMLDEEVRARMKHLDEGTSAWEVEYQKTMEQIKRKHKLV